MHKVRRIRETLPCIINILTKSVVCQSSTSGCGSNIQIGELFRKTIICKYIYCYRHPTFSPFATCRVVNDWLPLMHQYAYKR